MSFTGVVRNGVITLQPETKLPEGTEVSITPMAPAVERLRRYTKGDPDFERAIAAFAEAEAKELDPLEGTAINLPTDPVAREQFRKVLSGG